MTLRARSVGGADDDAVGFHEVVYGYAFPEEFGIGDDVEFDFDIFCDGGLDFLGGADGDGAFIDDDLIFFEQSAELLGYAKDIFQSRRNRLRRAAWAARGR